MIGGKSTTPGEFPYQVAIQWDGEHSCSGGLITEQFVVTANHCITPFETDEKKVTVVTGLFNVYGQEGEIHEIAKVISYSDFRQCISKHTRTNPHDIAVIKARFISEYIRISKKKLQILTFRNCQNFFVLA